MTTVNNKFEYSIYRKPTLTKAIIPHDSNHPYSHKDSSINSILYKLLGNIFPLVIIVVSMNYYNINSYIIHDIAHNNNFGLKTIKKKSTIV